MVLKRIGVTGATGMLGRHVVKRLERDGMAVIQLTRGGAPPDRARQLDLLRWPSDAERAEIFDGLDCIVHCAAVIPAAQPQEGFRELFDVNVRSCAMLGDSALTMSLPVVFISSASVYEDPYGRDVRETDSIEWSGLGGNYALTKILAEEVLKRLRHRGLNVAIVRPSSLYGFGEPPTRIVSKFLGIAAEGGAIEVSPPFEDGFNLVHAADVANAVASIIQRKKWGIYNVPGPKIVTIRELAEACVASVGRGSVKLRSDLDQPRQAQVRFDLNASAARRDIGYAPLVDVETGVRALYEKCVLSAGI